MNSSELHKNSSEGKGIQFLLEAEKAVREGRIEVASGMLNRENLEMFERYHYEHPSNTNPVFVLAMILIRSNRLEEAEQWYRRVLRQGPSATAWNGLGCVCQFQGRVSEAVHYHRLALEKQPDNTDYKAKLARSLLETGRTEEGLNLLKKTVDIADNGEIHSNLLLRLHYDCSAEPGRLYSEHRNWAKRYAPPEKAEKVVTAVNRDRVLKVGYVSSDFRRHSVCYFIEPVLDHHDKNNIQVFGYGNVSVPDEITSRVKTKFSGYRNIYGVSAEESAEIIKSDHIDILVDLNGHSRDNRLDVFAMKPAPVTVTYLGYPDTTGMEAMDYRLTDRIADPPQMQQYYSEQLVYLPEGFLCYMPNEYAGPVSEPPVKKKGYVTFGSFNNHCKINPGVISVWSAILRINPDFRLILKFRCGSDEGVRDYYLQQFVQNGIEPGRIEILGWMSPYEHLKLYERIDIGLDTWPYNGTTTTCEALWMGVPVVSMAGQRHSGRVGRSILTRIGLNSFCVENSRDYAARAAALADNMDAISGLRNSMRARIAASGLCYAEGFTRMLEKAYRCIWERWCAKTEKT